MYNPYDQEKYPRRKSPRLQGYDYSESNFYFVTICTDNKKCIFDAEPEFKRIVQKAVEEIPDHFAGAVIEKYVVMPNHVHMLIGLSGNNQPLDRIVGTFKAHVTRQIHKVCPDIKIWQSSFHDHIVRDEKGFQNIWLYIDSNPMNWEKDCFYTK